MKKHTLWLRDGDWDYLHSLLKPRGIAPSFFIRNLVSSYVDKCRKREEELREEAATTSPDPEIKL